jgi:hypothetical protein
MRKGTWQFIVVHTNKKENKVFLIDNEIQTGADAKSYTVWLTASSYMSKYLRISSYIGKPFSYMTRNRSNLTFRIYEENSLFFISVVAHQGIKHYADNVL